MGIRARFAIFYTVLVGCTLTLVGMATYQFLRHGLLTEIERDVLRRASVFAASNPIAPYQVDVFAAPDIFLQVVDATGTPLVSSGNLGGRLLPLSEAARARQVVEVRVGGRPLYLTAAPLLAGRFVVVARSPVTIYGALGQLRKLLTLIVGSALVLTGTLGWLFARTVVSPIERVVAAAEAVKAARDLRQRVAYRGPQDEIGRLAATFNAMLAELERAYRTLDDSNKRLRQFLADCTHELRAPLTLILSNLDLLAKVGNSDPAFQVQALADIRSETGRMARMITQLLILSRAETGTQLSVEPILLGDVVADACRYEQGTAEGVRLVSTAPESLGDAVVAGNADYLKQLFLILVDNAVKYSPPGCEVRVAASLDDGRVQVTVSDTGHGIDPQDLPHIFERFYRGRNAAGTTGTGLGLAIARWVAEQHGGRIDVSSTLGQGSTFTVVLPIMDRGASES